MGSSRRSLAAVALVLGCLVGWVVVLAAPGAAAARPAKTKPQPPGPAWSIPAAEHIFIEATRGTDGVAIAGVGSFRGRIEIVRTARGLSVVNDVAFEDYVRGISEVPNVWPLEALKAQAIAARTYALWEMRTNASGAHRAVGADICATQACQVYTGLTKERSSHGNRWTAAVEATAGEVLWWRDGPINAKYSSSNGGQSIPGGQPYLRSVNDPDDAHSPLHRWEVVLSASDVAAALGFPGKQVTAIQRLGDDVLVTAKFQPYDLEEVPSHLTLHAVDFRERINGAVPRPENVPRTLPTPRFAPYLTSEDSASLKVVFAGRGWGHGIGLSQWGAFGKAARGMKAADILASYYSGLKPVSTAAPHVPERIKVAVALDEPAFSIAPADPGGRIRFTRSTGEVLAHGSDTAWSVTPTRGAIEVRGGSADIAPATVTATPGGPFAPGDPIDITVRLSHDAHLSVTAVAPGSTAPIPVGAARVFRAGDLRFRLPAAQTTGEYTITVESDRGGGRRGTATIVATVAIPPAQHPKPPVSVATTAVARPPLSGTVIALLAIAAFVGVAARTAKTALGRNAPLQLH